MEVGQEAGRAGRPRRLWGVVGSGGARGVGLRSRRGVSQSPCPHPRNPPWEGTARAGWSLRNHLPFPPRPGSGLPPPVSVSASPYAILFPPGSPFLSLPYLTFFFFLPPSLILSPFLSPLCLSSSLSVSQSFSAPLLVCPHFSLCLTLFLSSLSPSSCIYLSIDHPSVHLSTPLSAFPPVVRSSPAPRTSGPRSLHGGSQRRSWSPGSRGRGAGSGRTPGAPAGQEAAPETRTNPGVRVRDPSPGPSLPPTLSLPGTFPRFLSGKAISSLPPGLLGPPSSRP